MNPEIETKVEAYLFSELPPAEAEQFEDQIRHDADLRSLVEDRREQAELVRRAFIRMKVREAQNEASGFSADAPDAAPARTVQLPSFRYAAAAAMAVLLAAAAWYFWQQTESLQNDIAAAKQEKERLSEKIGMNETPAAEPPMIEKSTETVQKDNVGKADQPAANDPDVKILTDRPTAASPKIAQNTDTRTAARPETYGTETRGLAQSKQTTKGETLYQSIHQKPDISGFKGTTFDGFVSFFEKEKYREAASRLSQMEVPKGQEDAHQLLLGIANLEIGDTNRAERHLMSIFEAKNPYYSQCQWWLALAFLREGKLDAARDIFQKIGKTAGHPYRAEAEAALAKF